VKAGSAQLKSTLFLALRRAGALIRKNVDRPNKVLFKGGSPINLVTWVDQAADRLIRQTIHRRFPDHDLLTEESVATRLGSPYKWIVDPLDGTTNYAHHFPQCCVSIALEYTAEPHPQPAAPPPCLPLAGTSALNQGRLSRAGLPTGEGTTGNKPSPVGRGRVTATARVRLPEVILAGVYDPFREELFWAEKGRGAFMKTRAGIRRLRVSSTGQLTRALLLTGFPYDRRERIDLYLSYVRAFMTKIQGIRRAGAAALDLCWVACGRVDGYWEWRLKPWDVAAGWLIVKEAGGEVSDFSGKEFSIYGEQTLATNGRVHGEMLRVMKTLRRTTKIDNRK
jgi:myo-inositol-1(or 4)-monophosphatase